MSTPLQHSLAGVLFLFVPAWPAPGDTPWELKPPAPKIALRPAKLETLEGETCGECHAAVVGEWSGTAHAIAWLDESYREALKEKSRPQTCYGCHVPKPLVTGTLATRAEARSDVQHLGIACATCHLGPDGAQLGPNGRASPAHKSVASDLVSAKGSSAVCSVCHATNIGPVVGIAKDFETSRQAERGRSCIGCHMQIVERQPAKGAASGAAAFPGRSHAIQTPRDPEFLARAFELSLALDATRGVLTIQNRAGHRVPGLIGREVSFQAELLDAAGTVVKRGELSFDAQSYLPVDKSAEIELPGAGGAKVHLVGLHRDPRANEPVRFLDVVLAPGR